MNYDIELNANDSSTLKTQYVFTQGDYGQIQFSIRVKADGVYVTNATRAYIVFTLPNGMIVTGADMPKNVATYTYVFQGNELQVAGTILADVKLVYTDGQISSNKFSFICRYDPLHDKSFDAGPYVTVLQKIVNDGREQINYLQALIDALQDDVGGTALTRSDLHNTRDAIEAGIKAVDANMAQNMLFKGDLVNNGTTTVAGLPLDARYGKTLKDLYEGLNSDLTDIRSDMGGASLSYFRSGTAGAVTTDANGRVYVTFGENIASANYQVLLTGLWTGNYVLSILNKFIHGFDVEIKKPDGSFVQNTTLTFDWCVMLSK